MKHWRRIAGITAAMLLFGTLSGCQGTSKSNQTLPEFSEKDVIYRSAWWCPEPTEEAYELYKECGLNTVFLVNHNFWNQMENFWGREDNLSITQKEGYYIGTPDGFNDMTATDQSLALAKEKGLYVYLAEGSYLFECVGQETNVYEDFTIDYEEYEDRIAGVFSGDEPSEPAMAEQAEKIPLAEKFFPKVPYFCNLFPMYADANSQLQSENYWSYLDAYCEQFLSKQSGTKLLSVDYYPFQGNNFTMWLMNYSILAEKAEKYDSDLHMFIQSCLDSGGSFEPLTENDIRLQVNVALAYGATRYSYYVYDTPVGGDYISGLVDQEGNPVEMYDYAKVVNGEMASLEHAFTHYSVVGTIPFTEDEEDYSQGAFSALTSYNREEQLEQSQILSSVEVDNRTLVTILQDEKGNEAFYLVNFYDKGDSELEEDCTVTLGLNGMKQAALYGSKECLEGKIEELSDSIYQCTLEPGEGILVIPFAG